MTQWLAAGVLTRARGPRGAFVSLTVIAQGLNGIASIVVFKWVDPGLMGYWTSAQLIQVPLDSLKIGVLSGLNREYPHSLGKRELVRAQQFVEVGLAHSLVICAIGVVAALAVLFFGDAVGPAKWAFVATLFVWSARHYAAFVRATIRSSGGFLKLGWVDLVLAALAVATLAAVTLFGYEGFLIRAVFVGAVGAIALFVIRPVAAAPRMHWRALWELIRFGKHTFIGGYLVLIGQQAERVLLLSLVGGVELLGLYTPVLAVWSLLQLVPGALQTSIYPKLLEDHAHHQDKRLLFEQITGQIRKTALLMLVVSLCAALLCGALVPVLLPKYKAAIWPIVIVCCAGPFLPLRMLLTYYAARLCWSGYYCVSALQAVLAYVFILELLRLLPPLMAAAAGATAATCLSSLALWTLASRHSLRA